MVIVGDGVIIAINGMSAGQSAFVNKQLNTLAPNIMFVSSSAKAIILLYFQDQAQESYL